MLMLKVLFDHLNELFRGLSAAKEADDIRLFQQMIDETFAAIDFEIKRMKGDLINGKTSKNEKIS